MSVATLFSRSVFSGLNYDKAHNVARTDRLERGIVSGCQGVCATGDAIKLIGETTKGSQAINLVSQTLNSTKATSKLLDVASVGLNWAGKIVNPILCVAAVSRAAAAEDKKSASIEEFGAMGTMFLVENKIKKSLGLGKEPATYVNNKTLNGLAKWGKGLLTSTKWLNKLPTNKLTGMIKGVIFIAGSCLAFAAGKKAGKFVADNSTAKDFELKKLQKEHAELLQLLAAQNANQSNFVA